MVGAMEFWDLDAGQKSHRIELCDIDDIYELYGLSFSKTAGLVAFSGNGARFVVVSLDSWRVRAFPAPGYPVFALDFVDNSHLVLGDFDGNLHLQNIDSGDCQEIFQAKDGVRVNSLEVSADQKWVCWSDRRGEARIMSLSEGIIFPLEMHSAVGATTISISESSRFALTFGKPMGMTRAARGTTTCVWEILSRTCVAQRNDSSTIACARFRSESDDILFWDTQKGLILWNWQKGVDTVCDGGSMAKGKDILQATISPDGQYLAAISGDDLLLVNMRPTAMIYN